MNFVWRSPFFPDSEDVGIVVFLEEHGLNPLDYFFKDGDDDIGNLDETKAENLKVDIMYSMEVDEKTAEEIIREFRKR